ncbi:MAG: sugar fermentation stimulation protein [bacterium]|nr:MAG: sugar fermentation stimulation protein [bacterium]
MTLTKRLLEATFISRPNRFLAIIELGDKQLETFVPNSGRMKELLIDSIPVLVWENGHSKRKTVYDLIAAWNEGEWVCIDSRIPNQFLYELLSQKELSEFTRYPNITKEVTYRNSRFDFFLDGRDKGCFIEAKSCTLVEGSVALFPDAPTKLGTKHLMDLISAVKEGYESYMIMIIQRSNAKSFSPNKKTDPEFASAMKQAVNKGVGVLALSTILKNQEILFHQRVEVKIP